MKLSIVVVNHNSCSVLRLALSSLVQATQDITHEFIVVDNASDDGSLLMLANEFPHARIIINNKDEGLCKANNQAMRQARGEYILLISSDTFSRADTLTKITGFMDHHSEAGGLSIRMVDRKGDYLPQSKHSLQNWVSFLKFAGLSSYFPKTFSTHKRTDWVDEFETAEIDALNEHCMLLRRSVLKETGLFDERFVRFGYNIDLSYRIRLHGFKNYYYSKTYIIQLPGKLLSKFSWNYMKHFYGAMFIFAAKYLFKLPVLNVKDIGELYPSSYEIE
ncbi:MAG: glycosyltransferase family 2 protein [Mucilaginibacter sp.]|nr:glycosyltransferase family 2 protein [Mucilaginibacter sp.]